MNRAGTSVPAAAKNVDNRNSYPPLRAELSTAPSQNYSGRGLTGEHLQPPTPSYTPGGKLGLGSYRDKPSSVATRANCTPFLAPSFSRIADWWLATVFSDNPSFSPIRFTVSPWASSRSTSNSRAVRVFTTDFACSEALWAITFCTSGLR